MAVTGEQVKGNNKEHENIAIRGTLSIARAMGAALREKQGRSFEEKLSALNAVLKGTNYDTTASVLGPSPSSTHAPMQHILSGKIISTKKKEEGGFSYGGFIIKDIKTGRQIQIGYQNEFLFIREKQSTGYAILIQAPDLIIVVDRNNFNYLLAEDIKFGQEVVILKMNPPKQMNTPQARKKVGPEAFGLDNICNFLDSH